MVSRDEYGLTPETRERLKLALARSDGAYKWEDVEEAILSDAAQLWTSDEAAIVTQVRAYPQRAEIHFWLAGGKLDAVIKLSRAVLGAAKRAGISRATLAGRRGWVRALKDEGWEPSDLVIMERGV
ncbi:MAG TPA: hypothetical protein VKA63_02360 [Candidatus Krumholzibacteria bacterium]|nr:hypothetical protein [Candidatus Krumholzibacteria bacterium]